MKRFLILSAIAGGLVLVSMPDAARADHRRYYYNYYSPGYSRGYYGARYYRPRYYRPSYGYYSPSFSFSIGGGGIRTTVTAAITGMGTITDTITKAMLEGNVVPRVG